MLCAQSNLRVSGRMGRDEGGRPRAQIQLFEKVVALVVDDAPHVSCAGLTRASMKSFGTRGHIGHLAMLTISMDCRVRPGNDASEWDARR